MKTILFGAFLCFLVITNSQNTPCSVPTIEVTGKGTVYGTPDLATFRV
jgi:uncharacterized protein YggE